jgi:hypothetical protein
MIPVTFADLPVSAWNDSEINYSVTANETVLLSGLVHVTLSPITSNFPLSFQCTTDDYTEIDNLKKMIGSFNTLVVSGTSYSDCYIANLGSIREIIRGSGKYTYSIKFGRADVH